MKKIIRVLLVLALLLIAGLAVYMATFEPARRPAPDEKVEITPARVERGRYLAHHVTDCFGCHADRDWTRYAGPVKGRPGVGGGCLTAQMGAPGLVCAPNITPDVDTGLGSWTDGEILRATREGIGRDGEALFPLMPYEEFRRMSDEDARSIVAYLRTVEPVRSSPPRTNLDFPVGFFIKMVPKPLDGPVPEPDRTDTVRHGEYLADIAGCKFCHSPVDRKQRVIPGRLLSGGHTFRGPWGEVSAPNLTAHETGLGDRSQRSRLEFIAIFRSFSDPMTVAARVGDGKDGRNTPMPWYAYAGMTDADLGAIYDYLHSLPPVENRVERFPRAASETASR